MALWSFVRLTCVADGMGVSAIRAADAGTQFHHLDHSGLRQKAEMLKAIVGDHGTLAVVDDDEVSRKLAMLIEGECEGVGPVKAAEKYGLTKQRYFQLRAAYQTDGAIALLSKPRGPKTKYRRTDELQRQVIRHRFLDPNASADVIAQKLRQTNR